MILHTFAASHVKRYPLYNIEKRIQNIVIFFYFLKKCAHPGPASELIFFT
jgi:hypothetical protein